MKEIIKPFKETRLSYPVSLKKLLGELNLANAKVDSARIISGLNILNSTGADKISVSLSEGKIFLTNITDETISFRYVNKKNIISDVVEKYQLLLIMKELNRKSELSKADILLTLEV